MKKLYGVITAMTTCFDKDDKVDVKGVEELTEFLINKGVNCLYPCGTTGEMHLMSVEERELVAETVVKKAAGRVTVFIHVGAMTTKDTIRLAQHAHKIGADGIGVVTPSYFGVNDDAMIKFFTDVAKSIPEDFPMYLYGIPQCAGNDLSFRVAEESSRICKNIIGVKYSYPDMHKICEFLRINDGTFSVVVGADRLFLPALALGCDGTVSGVSCPMPEPFVKIYEEYQKGNIMEARKWHDIANDLVILLKAGSDMSIFKNVLNIRGINGGYMRKPLQNIDLETKEKLVLDISKYQNIIN